MLATAPPSPTAAAALTLQVAAGSAVRRRTTAAASAAAGWSSHCCVCFWSSLLAWARTLRTEAWPPNRTRRSTGFVTGARTRDLSSLSGDLQRCATSLSLLTSHVRAPRRNRSPPRPTYATADRTRHPSRRIELGASAAAAGALRCLSRRIELGASAAAAAALRSSRLRSSARASFTSTRPGPTLTCAVMR